MFQGNAKHVLALCAQTGESAFQSIERLFWSMQPARLPLRWIGQPAKGRKPIIKQPMLVRIFMTALDMQKSNGGSYFAAAAVLIFVAAMLAGPKSSDYP